MGRLSTGGPQEEFEPRQHQESLEVFTKDLRRDI